MEVFTGFLIGIFGSFHCIGMCGPLALALPVFNKSRFSVLRERFLYNFGRVITYTSLGMLFGLFGNRIYAFTSQRFVTISIGIILILSVIFIFGFSKKFYYYKPFLKINDWLKKILGEQLKKHNLASMFLIGIVNGFLPCGFVYISLAGAIAVSQSSFLYGGLYMFFFGLGTIPALLIVSFAGNYISLNIRRNLSRAVPVFAILLGIIFILRGLNLGIPYISPSLNNNNTHKNSQSEVICH